MELFSSAGPGQGQVPKTAAEIMSMIDQTVLGNAEFVELPTGDLIQRFGDSEYKVYPAPDSEATAPYTISRSRLAERVLANDYNRRVQLGLDNGASRPEAEARASSHQNRVIPDIRFRLQGVIGLVGPAQQRYMKGLESDPEYEQPIIDELEQRYALYETIGQLNPALLDEYLPPDSDSRRLMDLMGAIRRSDLLATEVGGSDTKTFYDHLVANQGLELDPKVIRDALAEADVSETIRSYFENAPTSHWRRANQSIRDLTTNLVAVGIQPEVAVGMAIEDWQSQIIQVGDINVHKSDAPPTNIMNGTNLGELEALWAYTEDDPAFQWIDEFVGSEARLAAVLGWETAKFSFDNLGEIVAAVYAGANDVDATVSGELGPIGAEFSRVIAQAAGAAAVVDATGPPKRANTLNEIITKAEDQILNNPTREQIIDGTPFGGATDIRLVVQPGSKGMIYEIWTENDAIGRMIPSGEVLNLPQVLEIANRTSDAFVPRSERPGSILEMPEAGGQRPWFQRTFSDSLLGTPTERAARRSAAASTPEKGPETLPDGGVAGQTHFYVRKFGWLTSDQIMRWNTDRRDIEEMKREMVQGVITND